MFRAETDHFWFVGTRRVIVDCLAWGLGSRLDGARVLDVGCGTGFTLSQLPQSVRAVGLDLSASALGYARERAPRASLVRGTAAPLPFATGSFDAVLALDVLEHLDDDGAAASELARVLSPGGVAVVTVPAYRALWSSHDEVLEHRRRYRLPEVRRLLQDAGLRLRRATYYNSWLFPLIAAARLLERVRGGGRQGDDDALRLPPAPLNRALAAVIGSERHLVRRLSLPVGVSCLCVAER